MYKGEKEKVYAFNEEGKEDEQEEKGKTKGRFSDLEQEEVEGEKEDSVYMVKKKRMKYK